MYQNKIQNVRNDGSRVFDFFENLEKWFFENIEKYFTLILILIVERTPIQFRCITVFDTLKSCTKMQNVGNGGSFSVNFSTYSRVYAHSFYMYYRHNTLISWTKV